MIRQTNQRTNERAEFKKKLEKTSDQYVIFMCLFVFCSCDFGKIWMLKPKFEFITDKFCTKKKNSKNNNNCEFWSLTACLFLLLQNRCWLLLLVARLNCECCTDCSVACKVSRHTRRRPKTKIIHTQTKTYTNSTKGDIKMVYIIYMYITTHSCMILNA